MPLSMTFKQQLPIRVLHVLGGMNRGGIETWLMHILRHIDRDRIQMDFLVHTNQPCAYDDEIRSLSSKVIPCLYPSRPWLYAYNFKRILQEYGPYDIVHSHVHHFSGFVLRLAQEASVPVRIAHSHLDSSPLKANARWDRQLYISVSKGLISHHATVGFGCSKVAAVDLFGRDWNSDPRWRLLYYGIDMTPFQKSIDDSDIRTQFGIPSNAFVIGHVGRFQEQKNHQFLLKIFTEVVKREPQAYLLLVGQGPLQANIEQQAKRMRLDERVIFAGSRSDVPRLMMNVMDVFVLPSLSEGLPMVGIEAQAAGLPLILSDVITKEVNKVKSLVKQISLSQSAEVWADAVLTARNTKSEFTQADSLVVMKNSEFNIASSVTALTNTYADAHERH